LFPAKVVVVYQYAADRQADAFITTTRRKIMTSKITKIAAGIVVTLGMVTTALADDKNRPLNMQLTPKSCTWIGTNTSVPNGKYYKDDDGTLYKCSDGWFTPVAPPPKKGTKGGSKRG
jgi:hypothetical protein